MGYKVEKFGINTNRRNYQKTEKDLQVFDLIKIQTEGYDKFLKEGIDSVLSDVYPVESTNGRIKVEYLSSKLERPSNDEKSIKESKEAGLNYAGKVTAKFRLTNNQTGEVKTEPSVYITHLPLMTPGGSFIINGSERVIISQIVRAPGAYFENMKAARSQAGSEASVYKVASVIPNRGAWIEWEYKDSKLLRSKIDDIKIRIDRSKKIKAGLLFSALGLTEEQVFNLYGKNELLEETMSKLTKDQKDPDLARRAMFKTLNTGDRETKAAVLNLIPNIFFNSRRYDLSETGRYKLNLKLSITSRMFGKELAEDLKSKEGKVILSSGTIVGTEELEKVRKYYDNGDLALTELTIDEAFVTALEGFGVNAEEAKQLTQVVMTKVYNIDDNGEKHIVNIIGNVKTDIEMLTLSDILSSFGYMLNLEEGMLEYDDIDSMSNRKIRNIYELLKNQFRIGLTRMERNLRDRISAKDTTNVTIKNATNHKLMEAAMKEFFNSSQLSQFMDQINPLAEVANKRRLTSLGPGGISRETASLVVRGIHDTHYGRIDPVETPEGPNIGLILNLAIYARLNRYGLLETPYFTIEEGVINRKKIVWLTADEEKQFLIAASISEIKENGEIKARNVIARKEGKFVNVSKKKVNLMDVSPKQMVSLATAHIPFLENNDANRALMGANMQRQAVPLIKPEAPIVATGIEQYTAKYSPQSISSDVAGEVIEVSSEIKVKTEKGIRTFELMKFKRSNQGTAITQWPRVKVGQKIKEGQIIADGPSIENGELAIGKNPLVAFTTWNGYNYEDAVIISERLVKDDVYTSIHVEEHKIEQRNTRLGKEEITSEIPNASKESLRNLDSDGVIAIGSEVKVGDVLVGKITPRGEDELSPEEKLLDAILGNKAKNTRDTSLRVPYGAEGFVADVITLSKENGDKLDDGVEKIYKVYIAQKRKIKEGDKMAGRHGNKAVISKVLPIEDMPYLEDGTPVDVMLNPLGVPSRMNIGQVLELHLGMAGRILGEKIATPVFNGADQTDIDAIMKEAGMPETGKYLLTDGITGESFDEPVAVGVMYMLKLSHMIDDKMHARSVGPYSLITQQPLRGKSQNGGQRFGEMEAWALEAYGASHLLQEMTTVKSDDIHGRNELYSAIAKGRKQPTPSIPEGFWVLYYEMRGLGLKLNFLNDEEEIIDIDDSI